MARKQIAGTHCKDDMNICVGRYVLRMSVEVMHQKAIYIYSTIGGRGIDIPFVISSMNTLLF